MKPYTKPALSIGQQISLLAERGLKVDEEKLSHILTQISYYRFSGYLYPLLQDKEKHIFKSDSSYESAFKIYCFDRELRLLLINELEKIEISFRTKIIYTLSHKYDGFWYQYSALFADKDRHKITIDKCVKEYSKSDEQFIKAYKAKYLQPLPPSWILLEIVSWGSLSQLFENLDSTVVKREIARTYGIRSAVLENWMHTLVYLRNVCAHHSRLWNRILGIQPMMPKSTDSDFVINKDIQVNKLYYVLCIIIYLLKTINPKSTFIEKLLLLFEKYPSIDKAAMGFPTNWKDEPLWN